MQEHPTIFSAKELKNRLKSGFGNSIPNYKQKIQIIENWQKNIVSGKYLQAKEEEIKPLFLTQFFGEVLDYDYQNANDWHLRLENKTATDSTKSDAALGFFKIRNQQELPKDVRVVIEIKDARTPLDKPQNRQGFKGSPVEQCFNYAAKIGENCKWVIVSNFLELRLYLASDMTKYERFDIMSLNDSYEFSRFYYLLANGQLFYENTLSAIDILLANRQEKEKNITKEFYEFYHFLRELFFYHLKNHNPQIAPLKLLEYAQMIMDRVVFVSVVKDYDLLPYNVLKEIEDIASKSWANDRLELWRQLKNFFIALDEGLPPRIYKFNGGLFKQNPEIDNLVIKDIFLKQLLAIGNYDFESDLNINILGHIFEQSITDIEVFKQNIVENVLVEYTETDDKIDLKITPTSTHKRKKEGIFYTPENITAYIVKSTIGAWLEEKKIQLGLPNLADNPSSESEKNAQIKLWEQYQAVLETIKILDPACGSGAFLTQAFDYLLREWQMTLDVTSKLKTEKIALNGGALFTTVPNKIQKSLAQIKKNIVNYNLFGVDLNSESVEITKLGLWLKSASKNDPLALLDSNIKCGNSLIKDKNITAKAFDWQLEFADIMQNGGFDVIVGNPPYVSANNMDYTIRQYFNKSEDYQKLSGKWDLYVPFIEKSLKLLNQKGFTSFIVPFGLLNQPFATDLRKWILDDFSLISIVDLHHIKVFADATVPTCIFVINKQQGSIENVNILSLENEVFFFKHKIALEKYRQNESYMFRTENLDKNFSLLNKIKSQGVELENLFYVSTGAEIHGKEQRTETNHLVSGHSKFDALHKTPQFGFKPYIEGAAIPKSKEKGRYCYPDIDYYLDYDGFYEKMRSPKFKELFDSPKIVLRASSGLIAILATFDTRAIYTSHKNILIIQKNNLPKNHSDYNENQLVSIKYLLGVLNSKLMDFYYRSVFGGFIDVYPNYLKPLPIIVQHQVLQSKISEKVDLILNTQQSLVKHSKNFIGVLKSQFKLEKINEALESWYELDWQGFMTEMAKLKTTMNRKTELEWIEVFNEQKEKAINLKLLISHTDKEIDQDVYKIYDLTSEEISMIEQASFATTN
ncbi:MAG: N-6 DNA methylase [Microscillaceae bacterium]|jgi:hypothetical protein|nr:N-6 DNA methylase [Microscillaceae bacterium]